MPAELPKKSSPLKESRSYVLRGVLMLLAGSALLLVCKLTSHSLSSALAAYAGGSVILLGNGFIIFGLLVYAGSREQ